MSSLKVPKKKATVRGMRYLSFILRTYSFFLLPSLIFVLPGSSTAQTQQGQTAVPALRVVVNSNQDGPVQADGQLTLREAVELVNGTLTPDKLSPQEQSQISQSTEGSRIEFNLPSGATAIQLQSVLPDLAVAGLTIDGSTQPGYDPNSTTTAEIAIPVPVVSITPAPNREVFRGFTVVADGITIRGLNMYGFNAEYVKQQVGSLFIFGGEKPVTLTTPPGNIVISHRNPPPDTSRQQPPNSSFPFYDRDVPPKGVTIENNWLGLTLDEKMPERTSAFGVYVFNSQGATIRRNKMYFHDGSAIITSVRGENTQVTENIIVGNGIAGMPDALRIEGVVPKSQIAGNLICANDGAGVYLFKPSGDVQVANNRIIYNGRRLRRAAVYLMGESHTVSGNEITHQAGPGVVVSAYPNSTRNQIINNRFAAMEGLSIDLNSQRNLEVVDFQRGDGPNPQRDSGNRRRDTGNASINAPEFRLRKIPYTGGQITLEGKADPGSEVAVYRISNYQQGRQVFYQQGYGDLNLPLGTTKADDQGNFSLAVSNLQNGDRVSAIATDPRYGTSEPSVATLIGDAPPVPTKPQPQPIPQCTTPPAPPAPPEPPPTEPPPTEPPPTQPPEPLRLRVPRNVHFALDKSFISPESAKVLDRVAEVLQQYPVIVIDIVGHTDPRASDEYNLALGRRRALATRNYLLRKGIAPERMTIRSAGETQLISQGRDLVNYARDRRAEITFKDVRGIDLIIESQEDDLQIER